MPIALSVGSIHCLSVIIMCRIPTMCIYVRIATHYVVKNILLTDYHRVGQKQQAQNLCIDPSFEQRYTKVNKGKQR